MTIARIKPANWAVNEKLTSAQMNAVDTNITFTLDKRSGQTDTLSSAITAASGSSLTFSSGANLTTDVGSIVALNGVVNMGLFSVATVYGALTCQTTSAVTLNGTVGFGAASTTSMYGTVNIAAGSAWYLGVSSLTYSGTNISGSANINIAYGSSSTMSFGGGSTVTNSGTTNLNGNTNITSALTLTATTTASNVTMTGTNRLKLASRQVTRTISANFIPATSGWSLQADALGTAVTTAATNQYGVIPLALPDGAVINSIIVWIEGGTGHAGAPANLPSVALYYKQVSSGGSGSILASQTGIYGSAPFYEAVHGIQMSSISYTVDRNLGKIGIYVQTESGANALSGFKVHGADVTFTVASMDDGPCN